MASSVAAGMLADAEMPSLGLLWDLERLREVINRDVSGVLLAGAQVRSLTVTQMTYRPLRQCFAVCNLDLDTGQETKLVVSFAKDRRLKEKAYDRNYASRRRSGRAVYLPEPNCLFERFPFDWQVPAMHRLFDPESLSRLLEAAAVPAVPPEELASPPRVITYRPHEACVIEYPRLTMANGAHLIAKVIADEERIDRFHRASQSLRRSFDGTSVWTPETYRPHREPRVLFMKHAPGRSVYETDNLTASIDLAAEALAAIHATPLRRRPRELYHVQAGIDHTRARTKRVMLVAPELAERANQLLRALEATTSAAAAPVVFLHGDYKASQLLIDQGRVAVIDLDSVRAGDPAVDLGNFLADLVRESLTADRPELRGLAERFLQAYAVRASAPGLVLRARQFQVVALVRMAMHAFRQQAGTFSDTPSFAPVALMNEAEACLQAL